MLCHAVACCACAVQAVRLLLRCASEVMSSGRSLSSTSVTCSWVSDRERRGKQGVCTGHTRVCVYTDRLGQWKQLTSQGTVCVSTCQCPVTKHACTAADMCLHGSCFCANQVPVQFTDLQPACLRVVWACVCHVHLQASHLMLCWSHSYAPRPS